MAIKSPPSISLDTLLSLVGLRLGDIRFAKIQMNLHMQTIAMAVLEGMDIKQILQFAHHKPDEDCSCTTAILIILTPNSQRHKTDVCERGTHN